jgi:hypothetical protein
MIVYSKTWSTERKGARRTLRLVVTFVLTVFTVLSFEVCRRFGAYSLNGPAVPIFVIVHDRLTVLRQSLASYDKFIGTPFEVVLVNINSTFPELLSFIADQESGGTHVCHDHVNTWLVGTASCVQRYMNSSKSRFYVVTDPDIALDDVHPEILNFYANILDTEPAINVVGPMLRIDDVPDHYALKSVVIDLHYKQFWNRVPTTRMYRGVAYHVLSAEIDTTFGMYRSNYPFTRLSSGVRTYAPFLARHLDWYLDVKSLAADAVYYMLQTNDISHWGGMWLKQKVQNASSQQ